MSYIVKVLVMVMVFPSYTIVLCIKTLLIAYFEDSLIQKMYLIPWVFLFIPFYILVLS